MRNPSHFGSKIKLWPLGNSSIRFASIGNSGGFTGRFTLFRLLPLSDRTNEPISEADQGQTPSEPQRLRQKGNQKGHRTTASRNRPFLAGDLFGDLPRLEPAILAFETITISRPQIWPAGTCVSYLPTASFLYFIGSSDGEP